MSPPNGGVIRSHTKPLSRLSRIGQVLGTLVVLAAILAIFYLRHTGWDHQLAKLFGAYKHKVATLSEYVEYKRDANRFYDQHSAAKLSFDCERIRDDLVKMTHEQMLSAEAARFGTTRDAIQVFVRYRLLGAWREGTVLHLANPSVADSGPKAVFGKTFSAWKDQVTELATVQHPRNEAHYGTLLQALFTKVTIHGGNTDEQFTVVTRRGSKFDACGPP